MRKNAEYFLDGKSKMMRTGWQHSPSDVEASYRAPRMKSSVLPRVTNGNIRRRWRNGTSRVCPEMTSRMCISVCGQDTDDGT